MTTTDECDPARAALARGAVRGGVDRREPRRRVRRVVPARRGDHDPRPGRVHRAAGDPGRRASRADSRRHPAVPEDLPHARAVDLRHRRGVEATGEVYIVHRPPPHPRQPARRHRLRHVHPLRGHLPSRHRGRGGSSRHRRLRVDWTETRVVNPSGAEENDMDGAAGRIQRAIWSSAATRCDRSSTTGSSSRCPIKEISHEPRTQDHRGVRRAHRRAQRDPRRVRAERGAVHRGPRRGRGLPLRDRGALGHVGVLRRRRSRPPAHGADREPRAQAPGRQPRRHLPLRPDPRRPVRTACSVCAARSRTSRSPSTPRPSTAGSTVGCSPTSTTASSRSRPTGRTRSCSARRRPGDGGNWVQLDPDARMLIVRSYFLREHSAQNDPLVAVRIGIEALGDVPPPPPLDDATLAARLRAGVAFLRQTTVGQRTAERTVARAVHGQGAEHRRRAVELPQRGRRRRRRGRHLLFDGPLGSRSRRRARDARARSRRRASPT